jgi:hypothetical protein
MRNARCTKTFTKRPLQIDVAFSIRQKCPLNPKQSFSQEMPIPSIYSDQQRGKTGRHFGRSSSHDPNPPTIGDPPTEMATWNSAGLGILFERSGRDSFREIRSDLSNPRRCAWVSGVGALISGRKPTHTGVGLRDPAKNPPCNGKREREPKDRPDSMSPSHPDPPTFAGVRGFPTGNQPTHAGNPRTPVWV